ncbi:tetratricopeptide repeat protein [[Eubacterium] cellulosolvens]
MSFFDSLFIRDEEELIKKSKEFIENLNTLRAIKILEKTLKLYPDSANVLYLMGIATIRKDRTIALDYFDRALKNKQDFEQAWFCKSLIFNSRLEFKNALNCIDKVLQINQLNSLAIKLKEDLLFYLRQNEKLKRYKKEIFELRLNDAKGLLEMVLISEKGKLIGAVDKTSSQNLFLAPGEFVDPKKYKTDKMGRLIFNKKNVTAIGDVIIHKSNSKSHSKKRKVFRKAFLFEKVLVTTEGNLLGDVKKMDNNDLYLDPGDDIDIRKYQLADEKYILLPYNGVTSIDDIILYQLPELDPKLVNKNHDEQMFIDQFFKSEYSIKLRTKI